MKYLINGFSPKMLDLEQHIIKIEKCSKNEIWRNKRDCVSAIGHTGISNYLHVPLNRMQIQLEVGDIAYIISPNRERKHSWYPPGITKEGYTFQKISILE